MTLKEYREKVNPCYGCDCYDEDYGCTMPEQDRWFACNLENENLTESDFVNDEMEYKETPKYAGMKA